MMNKDIVKMTPKYDYTQHDYKAYMFLGFSMCAQEPVAS